MLVLRAFATCPSPLTLRAVLSLARTALGGRGGGGVGGGRGGGVCVDTHLNQLLISTAAAANPHELASR